MPVAAPRVSPERIKKFLWENRTQLDGFSYYHGDEAGVERRSWEDSDLRVCYIFSGPYETASGNLAVPLIASMSEALFPNVFADRCYFPSSKGDIEKFKKAGIPLFALESKRSLKDFDIVCFSLSYSVPVLLALTMMDMAGITLETADRTDEDPIIMGGGHSYHAFSTIDPAIDVVAGGDGEHLVPDMINAHFFIRKQILEGKFIEKAKSHSFKDQYKYFLSTNYKGFYVPEFYDFAWKTADDVPAGDPDTEIGSVKSMLPNREGVPLRPKVAFFEDWDRRWLYTKPFIPFSENQMFLGQLLVSKGCENKCSFCQETFTDGPYREMKGLTSAKAMQEIYTNSGTADVTPSAYTFGSFTDKKYLMATLIENVTDHVNLISERINDFEDKNLADLASFVGDKTISFGFEGNSDRMRRRFNKNISEDEILSASRWCMRAGYQKIKYFMISNPPMETMEDVMEIVGMARKMSRLRDEENASTQLMLSWTQMVVSSCTPMQWFNIWPSLSMKRMWKITPYMKDLNVGFRFGTGGVQDENFIQVLIHMGDRRLFPIFKKLTLLDNFVFYGSVPGGSKDRTTQYLHEYGMNWDMFFGKKPAMPDTEEGWEKFEWSEAQNRSQDHIFSHELWDTGVKRWYLWKEFQRYMTEPVMESERCLVKCEACGACTKESLKLMVSYKKNVESPVDPNSLIVINQRGTARKYRLKLFTDRAHTGVAKNYWRASIRRAARLAGVPLSKDGMEFGSDDIKTAVRVYGIDYVDFRLYENPKEDAVKLIKGMNKFLRSVRVLDARPADDAKQVRGDRDSVLYRVGLPFETAYVQDRINHFMGLDLVNTDELEAMEPVARRARLKSFPQVSKVEVTTFKDSIRVLVDTRRLTVGLRAVKSQMYSTEMYAWIRGLIVPQHLMDALFKMQMAEASRLDTLRMEYLAPFSDADPEDLFSAQCTVCGKASMTNMFHDVTATKKAGEEQCLRCFFGENYSPEAKTLRLSNLVNNKLGIDRKRRDERMEVWRKENAHRLAGFDERRIRIREENRAAGVVLDDEEAAELAAAELDRQVKEEGLVRAATGANSYFGNSMEDMDVVRKPSE